jgi:tetratricopeptide (TPR) repeat protein
MIRNSKGISVFTLAAILLSIIAVKFCLLDCCPSTLAKNSNSKEAQTKNKSSDKSDSNLISNGHKIDWRKKSTEAGILVFRQKYAQADAIFVKILPLARKEDPNGIELGVCLLRYGYCFVCKGKNKQALPYLAEALKIIQRTPVTKRQKKATFQVIRATSVAYLRLNQFDKGERFARKAIAYRIAFPEISSLDYFKGTYYALRICLEKQNKLDEASVISEIMNSLS